MASAPTTTPAETAASAAMWMNAPRILRSPFLPRANRSAVAVLMTMPMDATTMTVPPATGCGDPSLLIASKAMAPITTSSNSPLSSAARIEDPRNPSVKRRDGMRVTRSTTAQATTKLNNQRATERERWYQAGHDYGGG